MAFSRSQRHLLLPALVFSCLIFVKAEDATAGTAEAAPAVDIYAISKQWEDYGRSVAAKLTDEQAKTVACQADAENLKTRIATAEASLSDRDALIKSVEKGLSGFASGGADLKSQLQAAVAKAAKADSLESQVKELSQKLQAADKAVEAAKAKGAEVELSYVQAAGVAAVPLVLGVLLGLLIPRGAKDSTTQKAKTVTKTD